MTHSAGLIDFTVREHLLNVLLLIRIPILFSAQAMRAECNIALRLISRSPLSQLAIRRDYFRSKAISYPLVNGDCIKG